MSEHEVLGLIRSADVAITTEDFDRLMEFYAADAVLVVEPGRLARGKDQIRAAFVAIAQHFKNDLRVTQGSAQVLEGGDTALVIMETVLETTASQAPIVRRATYVFAKGEGGAMAVYGRQFLWHGRAGRRLTPPCLWALWGGRVGGLRNGGMPVQS